MTEWLLETRRRPGHEPGPVSFRPWSRISVALCPAQHMDGPLMLAEDNK